MDLAKRKIILFAPHILAIAAANPVFAQTYEIPVPPIRSNIDGRGVDLSSGGLTLHDPQISIGSAANGLQFERFWSGRHGWRHNYMIYIRQDAPDRVAVVLGRKTTTFKISGGSYVPESDPGVILTSSGANFTFTDRDGVEVNFDSNLAASSNYYGFVSALATVITRPTGEKTYLDYKKMSYPVYIGDGTYGGIVDFYVTRLQSVRTSTGFQLKFTYGTNVLGEASVDEWMRISNVRAINNSYEGCEPTADDCPGLSSTWSSVSYAISTVGTDKIEAVTDPEGRVRRYVIDGSTTSPNEGRLTGVRRPSSGATNSVSYEYSGGRVSNVAVSGVGAWSYEYTPGAGTLTTKVATPTLPASSKREVVTDTSIQRPISDKDENGNTTTFEWCPTGTTNCSSGQLTKVRQPEGNYTTFSYDGRGNVTSAVAHPKPGSALVPISSSAVFSAVCSNVATCNKPITTTDSAGKTTNYNYNSNGTIQNVQLPAPASGLPRPEVHYTYKIATGWHKANNDWVNLSSTPIVLPTGTITCINGSWPCAPSDQLVTEIEYASMPRATNLLASGNTLKRGDNTEVANTYLSFDRQGNVARVIDPIWRISETEYGLDRRPRMIKAPNIDGGVTARQRALAFTYDANGQLERLSSGVYDPNASPTFQTLQSAVIQYDAVGRKVLERIEAGADVYSIRQWSYNGAGRPECEVVRMNPTAFNALPGACNLGPEGLDGPDRITRYEYENAGAIAKVQTGYGTVGQRDVVTYGRTSNGLVNSIIDAKGNETSYLVDGYDRVAWICYNTALTTCQSGLGSDSVQFVYNSAGQLAEESLRSWQPMRRQYSYDGLGRISRVYHPLTGATDLFDASVDYSYDNLGRLISAVDANGHSVTYGYDALGRITSEGDASASRTITYDAAGQRTRLTWPDSRYITYHYNAAGEVTAIKENGSINLATYSYDDLGRRTSLVRGNGVITNYQYDGASRLTCLTHNLGGGGNPTCSPSVVSALASDQATRFEYNSAGQIKSRVSANDAYAWGGHYNVNRNYAVNGLNQYTAVGPNAISYDHKGNLRGVTGSNGYTYSTKNELVWNGDTGVSFYHDPAGRIKMTMGRPGGDYGFRYVGGNITDKFGVGSGTPTLQRYVYGAGVDEPLVWYEGADFASKRYLVADERGSIVAVTDGSGNATAINTYDEYGIPGSGNQGLFQYTGQAWISELGMYSYKARIYSPTLGRFLQTDPIGYSDGPNWYNYVSSDPVNRRDPTGLSDITVIGKKIVEASVDLFGSFGFGYGSSPSYGGSGGSGVPVVGGGMPHTEAPPEDTIISTGNPDVLNIAPLKSPFIFQRPGVVNYVSMLSGGGSSTPQSGKRSGPCPMPADVARAYDAAKNTAFRMFDGSKEVGYTITRSDLSGALHTSFTMGVDGRIPEMTLGGPGQTLVATGHIHNNGVGPKGFLGLGGWVAQGPSGDDRFARSHFPSAAFVLHENVGGEWRDSCY